MQKNTTGQPPRSCSQHGISVIKPSSLRRSIGLIAATLSSALFTPLASTAATYYQSANQYSGGSWSTTSAWNSATNGSGSAPSSITPADDYVCNRRDWFLRTPTSATTWPGGPLTLGPANLTIVTKSGTGLITIPELNLLGEGRLKAGDNTASLRIGKIVNNAPDGRLATHDSNNSVLNVSLGTVTGTGDFNLYYYRTTGRIKLTMDDATSYQGSIIQADGYLEFENALSSAGSIGLPNPAKVTLNHDVTFTSATVNGVALALGTHTAASLGFTGTGTLTVRAPATWHLAASQSGSQDWTGAWASQWNVNSTGSGAAAPSVNILDTYIVDGSGRLLRSPATTSTFGGASLTVGGSGTLQLAGGDTAISTVPELITTGGTITTGSGLSGTRNLSADTFNALSGTTTVTVGSSAQLNLFVYDFKGAGNLAISANSGTITPFIHHGNGFTGTITVNSGATVNFTETFGIAGAMNVSSTANITVADWLYVTGLTVGGVTKPLGTYTAASLGWSGPGSVTVYERALAAPEPLTGVNLAGAEFDGHAFWQTNPDTWDYFLGKGVTLVRMPFDWERVQGSLFGTVSFTNLDACIALASARGMKVILDVHSYNRYNGNFVGSPSVPHAALADLWSKIADHYKNEPAVYGYDIMNEPESSFADWAIAAQLSVDAIRKKDTSHYVLIEGMFHSNASYWSVTSPTSGTLDIKDPAGRLIYSAHSYWDYKDNAYADPAYWGNDGNYRSDDVPHADIGVEHVAPFVEWLQTRPYAHGNIGEYCIPSNYNAAGWDEAMDNFLTYTRANNISTTYWAGGNNWTPSYTTIQPQPLSGPDKPQMATFELYSNYGGTSTEVIVDNLEATLVGTWLSGTHVSGYYGTNYIHDNDTGQGTKTAQFVPELTGTGSYEVFVRWTAGWNRATNAPVYVAHSGGTYMERVDQKENNNTWYSLGTFAFSAGTTGSVTLGNDGANGHVIADAVKFTPVP